MSTKTRSVTKLPNELVVEGKAFAKQQMPSDKKSQKLARKTLKRNKGGSPLLFLRDAQTKITELNGHLQKKCPNLRLRLDFVKNLSGTVTRYSRVVGPTTRTRGKRLILCLYKDDSKCISSIEMNVFFGNEFTINSRTDKEEEGKKYNKMLRAVVMLVGGLIPGINHLHSVAENPISAWLLIHNFQVEYDTIGNDDFFNYLRNGNMDINNLSREQIFAFYGCGIRSRAEDIHAYSEGQRRSPSEYADKTQDNLISLNIPFNTHNTNSAMKIFMNSVNTSSSDSIVC